MATQSGTRKLRKILLTAALPYANGPIHIGHLVEYLQADFWARFQRMRGNECRYFCADDTHGTPIMVEARKRGLAPEEWIAQVREDHLSDFKAYGVVFDHYGSTHSLENQRLCEEFYQKANSLACFEQKPIDQLYCNVDKMFLPDRFVRGICPVCKSPDQYGDSCDKCGSTYNPADLGSPRCSVCGTAPVLKQSSHLFFKLNKFREFLLGWVPQHVAAEIANKQMEWLEKDLRDWDVSRDAPYFGFAIPGHPEKFFYVWVDAPLGYVSTTLQWAKETGRNFDDYWRNKDTEIYHFIGKDIVYFHVLFWPAMLNAMQLSTPSEVFVHGFLTVNGEKMSKSKGTFLSAKQLREHIHPEHLRYYYACKLNGTAQDLDLSASDLANRVNSDLVGKITNLGSRGAQMLSKKMDGKTGVIDAEGLALLKIGQDQAESIAKSYEDRDFAKAMVQVRELAEVANRWFDERAPWKCIDAEPERVRGILSTTLNYFRILSIYLAPILPDYAKKVSELLGDSDYCWDDVHRLIAPGTSIATYTHLATRMDPKQLEAAVAAAKPA